MNERLIFQEFSKGMDHKKQESQALDMFFSLKDSNIRRQTDLKKLRSRLENLKSDVQIS